MDRSAAAFIFESVWDLWQCKKDKVSSRKAFEWALTEKKSFSIQEIKDCISLFNKEKNDFEKENTVFGNWIRDGKYQSYLKVVRSSEFKNEEERIEKDKQLSFHICNKWNEKRRPWWTEVIDIQGRARHVQEALKDDFFRENWEHALLMLTKIFKYRRTDGSEYLKNLTPSIQWFCNREHNVVAKILEGEYGRPIKHEGFKIEFEEASEELTRHSEDILNVTMTAFKYPQLRQDVSSTKWVDGVPEIQAADWYVVSIIGGSGARFILKFRGVDVEAQETSSRTGIGALDSNVLSVFETLKAKAIKFNSEGYAPSLPSENCDSQTEEQQEFIENNECPI